MLSNVYDDEVPNVVKIKKTIIETPTVKTFIFPWKITEDIHPGQFVMVWDFNNEKPMTLSVIDKKNNLLGISVRKVGTFSENLYDNINEGDLLGIRGPYGHGYEVKNYKKVLGVGGGSGISALTPLAALNDNVDLISAACTKDELMFVDRFENMDTKVYECTDDGTAGYHGFSTELAEELLQTGEYDAVVSCGPEIMSYKLYELSKKYSIDCQVSLDRYMKCGVGICGQCCLDDAGFRACVEGPVFNQDDLAKLPEFGHYRRDASGSKIKI